MSRPSTSGSPQVTHVPRGAYFASGRASRRDRAGARHLRADRLDTPGDLVVRPEQAQQIGLVLDSAARRSGVTAASGRKRSRSPSATSSTPRRVSSASSSSAPRHTSPQRSGCVTPTPAETVAARPSAPSASPERPSAAPPQPSASRRPTVRISGPTVRADAALSSEWRPRRTVRTMRTVVPPPRRSVGCRRAPVASGGSDSGPDERVA